ncbi:alpha/beta hydrolase [Actinoplanes awajinensis]|uniref:Transporter n=1 Tax=Actinoplanes awajinensis subsp. mycoplanecinus TaxID=135947 RepID=A0A0X3UTN1_9ACTN|nr:alpha/beta hydrolase [Actinoplanes awajinensis]KUL35961.1 transporter [Actinoplanes awajinensis subsp. mycoplanecinus]
MVMTTGGCTLPAFAPEGAADPAKPADGGGGVPTTGSTPGAAAQWSPCTDVPEKLVGRAAAGMSYDCATVAVPRDWSKPVAGETYDVAMIRIRSATQKDRIGSLLVNPGGPGGSGIDIAVYLSFGEALGGLPKAVTDKFDLVGFDPRGVSRSSPLKCISNDDQDASFAADPDPVSQAEFDEVTALNKKIADGCGAKYGDQLPYFSTVQAARDMDALRAAVGDPKLTYLGFSYGTLLGATYAQLFPQNVRALVLDGAVDPTENYVQGSETQAKGFERAFTNFTAWCKQNAADCPIAADPRGAVTDAMAKAENSPVAYKDGRQATAGWIFVGLISSLYTKTGWTSLAQAIDELQGGDAKGIMDLADQYAERETTGSYSNLFDANLAVNCADTDDAPTVAKVRALQSEWRKKYPLFGAPLAMGMLPCTYWPGKRDPYPAGKATGAPPIVVVGTTGDPATPYENTADLAKMLGTGHVVTWEGEGHTAYPSTPCIVRAVDNYLIDLTVPQEGLRCPAK